MAIVSGIARGIMRRRARCNSPPLAAHQRCQFFVFLVVRVCLRIWGLQQRVFGVLALAHAEVHGVVWCDAELTHLRGPAATLWHSALDY